MHFGSPWQDGIQDTFPILSRTTAPAREETSPRKTTICQAGQAPSFPSLANPNDTRERNTVPVSATRRKIRQSRACPPSPAARGAYRLKRFPFAWISAERIFGSDSDLPAMIRITADRISRMPAASRSVKLSPKTVTPIITAVSGSSAPMIAVGVEPIRCTETTIMIS